MGPPAPFFPAIWRLHGLFLAETSGLPGKTLGQLRHSNTFTASCQRFFEGKWRFLSGIVGSGAGCWGEGISWELRVGNWGLGKGAGCLECGGLTPLCLSGAHSALGPGNDLSSVDKARSSPRTPYMAQLRVGDCRMGRREGSGSCGPGFGCMQPKEPKEVEVSVQCLVVSVK